MDEDEALKTDARWYANRFNVSLTEAINRLTFQEAVGELNARLSEQEKETFAGLWIVNEPEYKIVIAFTKDGEKTLQPYLQNQPYKEYIELRTYRYSLADLAKSQEQGMTIVTQLGLSAGGAVNVQENRATLIIGNPESFLQEVQAAGINLPESLKVSSIDPNNPADTNRGSILIYTLPGGQPVYFPKQPPQPAYPEGEFAGVLILDENGCLRLESWIDNWVGDAPLILWRHDLDLRVVNNKIEIFGEQEGIIAQTGKPMQGGGGFSETAPTYISGMPLAICPGPYLQVGTIEPLANGSQPNK